MKLDAFNKFKELPIPDPIGSLIEKGKNFLMKKSEEYLIRKAGEAIKERSKDAIADKANQICAEADAHGEKGQIQFKERYDFMNYGYWCGRKMLPPNSRLIWSRISRRMNPSGRIG